MRLMYLMSTALAVFRATLRRLWGLRWEHCHKEPLWRLAVHGVASFPAIASQAARGGGGVNNKPGHRIPSNACSYGKSQGEPQTKWPGWATQLALAAWWEAQWSLGLC
jgi:hypothetical protein